MSTDFSGWKQDALHSLIYQKLDWIKRGLAHASVDTMFGKSLDRLPDGLDEAVEDFMAAYVEVKKCWMTPKKRKGVEPKAEPATEVAEPAPEVYVSPIDGRPK